MRLSALAVLALLCAGTVPAREEGNYPPHPPKSGMWDVRRRPAAA